MRQTAGSHQCPQLTVPVPVAAAGMEDAAVPARGFAAAAGLAGPLAAGPLAPELEPHPGVAAAAAGEDDVLSLVWRAGSRLESTQWELDNAQESLRQAVRIASAAGIAREELCEAANLTAEELSAVLAAAANGPTAVQL